MYIINVNHDSVIKQICQFRGHAYLINETLATPNDETNVELRMKHLKVLVKLKQ